jgi:hypothetical protein
LQRFFATRGAIRHHRTGDFQNLQKPERLGLFFCVERKEEMDQIRSLLVYLKTQYKSIHAWIFNDGYYPLDVVTDKSIFLFDLNDFTLLGKKRENLQRMFDTNRFELMVSFVFQDDMLYLKLFSEINADFKIGPYLQGTEYMYDMTLRYQPDLFGFSGFFENIRHYLAVMNINQLRVEAFVDEDINDRPEKGLQSSKSEDKQGNEQ